MRLSNDRDSLKDGELASIVNKNLNEGQLSKLDPSYQKNIRNFNHAVTKGMIINL